MARLEVPREYWPRVLGLFKDAVAYRRVEYSDKIVGRLELVGADGRHDVIDFAGSHQAALYFRVKGVDYVRKGSLSVVEADVPNGYSSEGRLLAFALAEMRAEVVQGRKSEALAELFDDWTGAVDCCPRVRGGLGFRGP